MGTNEAGQRDGAELVLGWREWAALPDLGVEAIRAKIDTGARTSAIHALGISPFTKDGRRWLRFEVVPASAPRAARIACAAPMVDERNIRNSGGQVERRYVIETTLSLGGRAWPVELSLANREEMGFRLLLGRTALLDRVLIRPGRSFLLGAPGRGVRRKLSGLDEISAPRSR
jgi:hypothetical protein